MQMSFTKPAATALLLLLAACAPRPDAATPPAEGTAPETAATPMPSPEVLAMYGAEEDDGRVIPAVDPKFLSDAKARQEVDYWTDEKPGTIVVDPWARRLYLVKENNRALRYTVAVGEDGRGFSGEAHIPYQREWPSWTPTQNMIAEDPELYGPVKDGLEGGLENPLGARALYLHRGGKDTLYRIHGTMDDSSIGKATSAGCIRLFNQDIIDLAERVRSGTHVVVLTRAQSGKGTVPPGQPLPPVDYRPEDFPANPTTQET
ncbi:L,D-transpeptidase [Thioclava atlantica]|uniref:ErfK/YbiS/YcfS/YnhG family protein n=1 Tax=Thioclava atlantica TaxID=1317124 RepID=A0A085TW51_9RHOB|nr:L,D-transpeptidase [Thioclava atlantica]KFE34948.1 ErfK/YbiS/YcfS/YnhG family protein [Thioclava atlantica]